MQEALQVILEHGWTAFLLTCVAAVVILGFMPRLVLRLLVLCFDQTDPRREELLGELDAVSYSRRWIWLAEQFEVALVEGIGPRALWKFYAFRIGPSTLLNGEQQNSDHPDSFWIPSREEIDSLRVGDLVKVGFELQKLTKFGSGERMWVKILSITDASYLGTLENYPVVIADYGPGDYVKFRREHIIDYSLQEDQD